MHLMLIQLNLLYASHEDAEEPKLLFPPAIVQGECQLPEKKLQTAIGEGAEIRNLQNCRWVFARAPELPGFLLD